MLNREFKEHRRMMLILVGKLLKKRCMLGQAVQNSEKSIGIGIKKTRVCPPPVHKPTV